MVEERGGKVIRCDLHDADIEVDLSTAEGRETLAAKAAEYQTIDAVLAIAGGGQRGLIQTNFFGAVAIDSGRSGELGKRKLPCLDRFHPGRWLMIGVSVCSDAGEQVPVLLR
jgi:hypothetical protein